MRVYVPSGIMLRVPRRGEGLGRGVGEGLLERDKVNKVNQFNVYLSCTMHRYQKGIKSTKSIDSPSKSYDARQLVR